MDLLGLKVLFIMVSGISIGYFLAVLHVKYGGNIEEMRKVSMTTIWIFFFIMIIFNLLT